jgi:hypothetical protein
MTPARLRKLLGSSLLLLCLGAALAPPLHDAGGARIDAMFTRALATFAAARALNGAISVVQGTEIALQPAGVGVTLTVGQALDPLNDLVERFSWIMLAATTALGTQAVLLDATAAPALAVVLVAVALLTLLRSWWRPLARLDATALIPRLLILLLFVRLAVPLAALGAHAFSEAWLEPRRVEAMAALERTRQELDKIETNAPPAPPEDASVLEQIEWWLRRATDRLDLDTRLARLGGLVDTAADRVVDLLVVFTLQTIVVPLGSLWVLWRLTRIAQPFPGRREEADDP